MLGSRAPRQCSLHMSLSPLDRRSFLNAGAGGAFFCAMSGTPLATATKRDVARADLAASRIRKPRRVSGADPVDRLRFPAPTPAPGGRVVTYWIEARSHTWDIAPHTRVDEWMKMRISGRTKFRALTYQAFEPGFAAPIGRPNIPGPTLHAEIGDVIEVHFRNGDQHYEQALTMHSHGVKYNPEYDGAYMGDFTRAGGFIGPGEEFTYRWEATPGSEGAWPYHDHGPNHTVNVARGMFGAVVIRPKGARIPNAEHIVYFHSFPPAITGRLDTVQAVNGRTGAGNTPNFRARVGDEVAFHVIGGDGNFHTFHIHGHRWTRSGGEPSDCQTVGPNETMNATFTEDNPGRWLYHCHVFAHQDAGMGGWYLVDP